MSEYQCTLVPQVKHHRTSNEGTPTVVLFNLIIKCNEVSVQIDENPTRIGLIVYIKNQLENVSHCTAFFPLDCSDDGLYSEEKNWV